MSVKTLIFALSKLSLLLLQIYIYFKIYINIFLLEIYSLIRENFKNLLKNFNLKKIGSVK